MIPRAHFLIVAFLLIVISLLSAAAFFWLPAQVPAHWNIHGQVDGYGRASTAVFLLPATIWLVMAILIVTPRILPSRSNFARFSRTYGRICVTIAGFLAAIQIALLLAAAGKPVAIPQVFSFLAGIVLAIVGNWLGKIRRNPLVGIRTPWTLANEDIWNRTNRAGARILVIFGLSLSAISFFTPPLASGIFLLTGVPSIGVWAMIYSWKLSHGRTHAHPEQPDNA